MPSSTSIPRLSSWTIFTLISLDRIGERHHRLPHPKSIANCATSNKALCHLRGIDLPNKGDSAFCDDALSNKTSADLEVGRNRLSPAPHPKLSVHGAKVGFDGVFSNNQLCGDFEVA